MKKLKDKLFNLRLSQEINELQEEDRSMGRAYAETYQVLQHTTRSVFRMIPQSFMKFLHENMDKTAGSDLDFSKDLMEMDLLRDTRILLSLVYRDFLCSDEERKMLVEKERKDCEAAGITYEDESLRDMFSFEG